MNVYPFFIECSKYFQNEPYKCKFLQKLAFGHGIHIIKRNDKNILVTSNGEFIIPLLYTDKARDELTSKLWQVNAFTRLEDSIKNTRQSWQTTRKKDKIYLLYKYVASLTNITMYEKTMICNLLVLALLLKILKSTDIDFKDGDIIGIKNENILKRETYTQMNFVYDYSIHSSTRTHDFSTNTAADDDEDD